MSETMVDRVAKAIYESQPLFMAGIGLDVDTMKAVPWAKLTEDDREDAREAARAAIEAMRVPTEKMMAAADEAFDLCWSLESGEGVDADPRLPIWDAMIDAALAPAFSGTSNG
jgi:alkylation response protein AidB-like acyl-CoA dehydrogenase